MTEHNTLIYQGQEVKALDDSGKIGGYLVVFSGPEDPDLTGDFFTAETDFGSIKNTVLLFNHGMDAVLKNRVLGSGEWKIDDVGVWVEGILNMRDDYEKALYNLAKQGKLGWSSGTASHLVEREKKGSSHWIKSWPLGIDASLTPTPAEPRTKAVELKANGFENLLQALSEAQPEAGQVAPDAASVGAVEAIANNNTKTTLAKMENEVKEQEVKSAPAPGHAEVPAGEAKATAFITLSKEEYDTLKAAPAPVREVKNVVDTSSIGAPNLNLKTERGDDEMKAWDYYLRTGVASSGISPANSFKADVDMQVGTPAEGGYLAPDLHYERIIARRDEVSIPRMAGVQVFTGSHKAIDVPVDAEDAGSMAQTAEEADSDRDTPAVGEVTLTAYKYTVRVPISIELLEDHKSNLLDFVAGFAARKMAIRENNSFVVGTGIGAPQGVFVGGTASETSATGTTITSANIINLMHDLPAEYADNAIWLMHRQTEGYVRGITGDNFHFQNTPAGNVSNPGSTGMILNAPVYNSSSIATIATTNKTIAVGNPFFYGLYDRAGLSVLRDPYSAAVKGQVVFHYSYRQGGAVLQSEAWHYLTQA